MGTQVWRMWKLRSWQKFSMYIIPRRMQLERRIHRLPVLLFRRFRRTNEYF